MKCATGKKINQNENTQIIHWFSCGTKQKVEFDRVIITPMPD